MIDNFNKGLLVQATFYFMAALIAPIHFKPISCPIEDKEHCRIWNCKYHYRDNKYDKCQM